MPEKQFSISKWAWHFGDGGKADFVRLAAAAAVQALGVWEAHTEPDAHLKPLFEVQTFHNAVSAIANWLESATEANRRAAGQIALACSAHARRLDENVLEASGSADLVDSRERAVYAAWAIVSATLAAACVAESDPPDGHTDRAEFVARNSAGPVDLAVDAVLSARKALGIDDPTMRQILEGVLKPGEITRNGEEPRN